MGPPVSVAVFFFSLFGISLTAYPYNPIREPLYPVQQPPSYLIYPQGVYKLTNNTTNEIKGQDFVFGIRSPQDKLLLHSTIYKRPGIWSSYTSKEIIFPPAGSHMRVNITQVSAYDRGVNATGGFVKMVRGGIGQENVTLLFRSQKNKPINFELDIFGVPKR